VQDEQDIFQATQSSLEKLYYVQKTLPTSYYSSLKFTKN